MTNLSKPGPELDAAIAVEVIGARRESAYSIMIPGPNPPWPSCGAWVLPDGTWRPLGMPWSTDPTTFFDDVVPRMRELRMRFEFEQSNEKPEEWLCLVCRIAKAHILLGEASHENHATAGCLAALAAVRAEAAKEE